MHHLHLHFWVSDRGTPLDHSLSTSSTTITAMLPVLSYLLVNNGQVLSLVPKYK